MKTTSAILRQLTADGLSFMMVLAVALGGLWGLSLIDASLFIMSIYSALMVPAVISTSAKLGRDIQTATHRFIA